MAGGVTTLSLLQTLVVPVLGTIAEQLRVSPGAAGWVLTANLLAAAVLTPVLGRLGDLRGERQVIRGSRPSLNRDQRRAWNRIVRGTGGGTRPQPTASPDGELPHDPTHRLLEPHRGGARPRRR